VQVRGDPGHDLDSLVEAYLELRASSQRILFGGRLLWWRPLRERRKQFETFGLNIAREPASREQLSALA
jgi:hypothetical protein